MQAKKWQDVDPRESAPRVACVDFGHGDGKPRYCIIGTEYGYMHTAGGDVRTWRSYSGARRVLRRYLEIQ